MFQSFRELAVGSIISLATRFRKGKKGWREKQGGGGKKRGGKMRRNEEKIHTERERKGKEKIPLQRARLLE